MMKSEVEIVIIGARGLIGEALLQTIAEHTWLSGHVQLLGGEDATGHAVEFGRQELVIGDTALHEFSRKQIVIFTGDEELDRDWLERAQDAGCIILDISSKLLTGYELPPVVAGVNPEVLAAVADGGIIELPDAATTQLTTLLKPIVDTVGLKKVSVFSCHAVSEMGRSGVEEMARQTAQLLNAKPVTPLLFNKQIAFNLIPQVGNQQTQGLTDVESKIIGDTKKVLGQPEMNLSVACCWAPVFYGHSQSVDIQFSTPVSREGLQKGLSGFSNISLFKASDSYPTAVTDASGHDRLAVGRIKSDAENSTDFSLWTVADNLRFGIAGNAVKIVEVLVKDYL